MNMSKNNSKNFVTVVVLNDGQTFTDISGCSICIVPLEQYEEAIRSGGDARDFQPVVEIGLDNMTIPVPQDIEAAGHDVGNDDWHDDDFWATENIYNDDLAISNSNSKGMNTMKNSKNTEQVARTANETECDRFNQHFCERRNWSHFYSAEVSDYHQWCSEFRECGLTRLADRVAAIRLDGCDRDEFTPAEQADLELAEIALRNLSTQTTGQDDEQEDRASLQAAVEAVSMERNDWQKSALEMTEDRDALRVLLAARNMEIDQLRDEVRELKHTVIHLARTASYTKGLADAQGRILEQEGARKREQRKCESERQANENEPLYPKCPF
jgi:hypothetical protein